MKATLKCALASTVLSLASIATLAAQPETTAVQKVPLELPRMQFLGKFDAGVPNAGIYKMYDKTDDIVCYILMPDIPETRRIAQGVQYSGNSIGSISCVKVKLHVVPLQPKKTSAATKPKRTPAKPTR